MLLYILLVPALCLKVPLIDYSQRSADDAKNHQRQYIVRMSFGNPEQETSILLDPTLDKLWVSSKNCEDCFYSSSKFNQSESTTFEEISKYSTYFDQYVDDDRYSFYGFLSADTVRINDLESINQKFYLVKDQGFIGYGKTQKYREFDGMLGLNIGYKDKENFFSSLKAQNQIEKSVFSVYFDPYDESKNVFTIGEYDIDLYGNGKQKVFNIDRKFGYWRPNLDSISIEDDYVYYLSLSYYISFDFKENLLILPTYLVNEYVSNLKKQNLVFNYIQNQDLYNCSCRPEDIEKYPVLKFGAYSFDFEIQPKNFLKKNNDSCLLLLKSTYSAYLKLGQPFFKEFYTVYDLDNYNIIISHIDKNYIETSEVQNKAVLSSKLLVATFAFVSVLVSTGTYYIYSLKKRQDVQDYHRYLLVR